MNPLPGAALLFDIDGTLVDSDRLHLQAFNMVMGPFGHTFDRERFTRELQGLANEAIMTRFFPDQPRDRQLAIMDEKEATFRRLAQRDTEPVHGLLALLDAADAAGLPMAAVTNAPRANAEQLLDAIGVRGRFKALVIGAELAHGKPHPLPYLEGLRLLGADVRYCVAFEDSRTGIASATAAGITTIGIRTSLSAASMAEMGAAMSADDYRDAALLALVARTVSGG